MMARDWQKATVMKRTDSQQILELLTRLTEELVGPVKARPRAKRKEPLSDRVDQLDKKIGTSRSKRPLASQVDSLTDNFKSLDTRLTGLDTKVTGLDTKIGTGRRSLPIAVQLDALDMKVDKRFDAVDRRIEATRDHVVDVIARVHEEVTKRVVDLEVPAPGRKGNGGRGSGGGGVPLAS
jgi:tetrahydromethanopterin S-methyltransferase subunit G